MRFWTITAAIALAGCASAAVETPSQLASDAPVAVEVNSWGSPIMRWSIDAAGNGSYSVAEEGSPVVKGGERPMKHITFHAGSDGYHAVRAALAPAERHAGKAIPCKKEITDMPYGTVHWGDIVTSFDQGCRSADADAFEAALEAALDQIVAFGKASQAGDH